MKMRNKLMAASLMLVVSILMMSTASFAWFTISTAPEITGMKSQVVVNENLEIAFAASAAVPGAGAANDTGDQTKWGNIIDITDTKDYASFNGTLRPLQINGNTFQYPTYGADGRISSFVSVQESATVVDKITNLVDTETTPNVYGYYYDMWIRTNTDGDIKLLTAAGTVRGSTDSATGDGSSIAVAVNGTGSAETTALQMAANYIQVGYKILGESSLTYNGTTDKATVTYTDVTINTATPVVPFTKTAPTGESAASYTYELSGIVKQSATANTAYLVRIYVWLDGGVTNAAASLDTGLLDGAINLQFTVDNVNNSMTVPTVTPTP